MPLFGPVTKALQEDLDRLEWVYLLTSTFHAQQRDFYYSPRGKQLIACVHSTLTNVAAYPGWRRMTMPDRNSEWLPAYMAALVRGFIR